jgi:hypothetical protein
MKKIVFIVSFLIVCSLELYSQNLISNPSFEEHYNNTTNPFATQIIFNDSFSPILGYFVLKNWMNLSGSMDAYWTHHYNDFPNIFGSTNIYPHTDSTIVAGFEFFHGSGGGGHCRELMEGKLSTPLIAGHIYKYGIWVQLFDTISQNDIGKIVGINSFSAYFSDTLIPFVGYTACNFHFQNYIPQVQINQMVTDTQHWVLLQDTFIAAGGEQYVCIGNFKTDAQLQWQLVDSIRNLPTAAYYYYDDVSLVDITPNGVEEQLAVGSNQLIVYPNPCAEKLLVMSDKLLVNTIEVTDVLGRVCTIPPFERGLGGLELNVSTLQSGIYFIKATDINGNAMNGKFVKQ